MTLLALTILAGTGWVLLAGLAGLAGAPPVSVAEGSFAARAFAINRFGFAAGHLPWFGGGAGALQVAAYETVSGALARAGGAVVAAREAMVVATALGGISLAVAARRLRLSVPATAVALLLYGFAPLAVLVHRTADPTNLGAMWAGAALAVAVGGGARRAGTAIVAVGYLALAVLSAPVVLLAVVPVATGLLLSGAAGRLPRTARILAAAAGLAGYLTLVWLTARGQLPGVMPGARPPDTSGLDQLLIVAAGLGALAGLLVRSLRPVALGVLGLGVAAAVAADARLPLTILALPLAAVLLPALADVAVVRWPAWWAELVELARRAVRSQQTARPQQAAPQQAARSQQTAPQQAAQSQQTAPQRTARSQQTAPQQAARSQQTQAAGQSRRARRHLGRVRRAVPAVVGTVVVLALGVGWVPAAGAARSGGRVDRALDQARDWVLHSLPTRPRLAVDDGLWAKLVEAGYPTEQLVAVGGLGRPAPANRPGWTDCVFVIGRDAELLAADPGDPARQARESSAIVAGWGVGADRVNARRILLDRAAALTQAVRDARSRAEAGTALSQNLRLTLAAEAVLLLRRGDVDARLIAVLASISGQHRLVLSTFPAVDGEDDRLPRRQLAVTAIDGQQVAPGATMAGLLAQWLAAQQPPYRPATAAVTAVLTRAALLISYDAVSQPGLLPP